MEAGNYMKRIRKGGRTGKKEGNKQKGLNKTIQRN